MRDLVPGRGNATLRDEDELATSIVWAHYSERFLFTLLVLWELDQSRLRGFHGLAINHLILIEGEILEGTAQLVKVPNAALALLLLEVLAGQLRGQSVRCSICNASEGLARFVHTSEFLPGHLVFKGLLPHHSVDETLVPEGHENNVASVDARLDLEPLRVLMISGAIKRV